MSKRRIATTGAGRQSLLGAGVISFAYTIWGLLLSLITVPILVHGLGLPAYGLYSLAYTFAGFGSYLDFGLSWTVSRFVAEAYAKKDQALLAAIVRSAFIYNVAVGLFFVAVLVPSAGWIAHSVLKFPDVEASVMAQVLRLAAISFLLSSIGGVLVSALRGLHRFSAATLIAGVSLTVSLVGAAVGAKLGMGVVVVTSLQLFGTLCGLLLGLGVCGNVLWHSAPALPVAKQLKVMLAFSAWNYMTRLIQMFTMEVDKVLVGRFAGAGSLAPYNLSFGVAQKINFVGGPAVTAIYPTAAAGRYEPQLFMKQYFSASRVVHMTTGAVAIATLVWADRFLGAWIGPEMASQGTFFLRAFAIGFWWVSVGSVDGGCIEGWNHPKVTFALSAVSLTVAFALGIIMFPFIGAVRAISLAVAGHLTFVGVGQIILWQRISKYPFKMFFHRIALPLAEMCVLGLVLSFALRRMLGARLLVMGALPAIAAALLLWGAFRSFASDERRVMLTRLMSLFGINRWATQ